MKKIIALILAIISTFSVVSLVGCVEQGAPVLKTADGLLVLTEENKDKIKYKEAKTYEYTPAVSKTIQSTGLGDGVMPIMGFWGPWEENYYGGTYLPDLRTPEIFEAIADAGINMVMQCNEDYSRTPEDVIQALVNCQNAGISYMVTDVSLVDIKSIGYETDISLVENSQEIWDYKIGIWNQYESFAGMYIRDEPVTAHAESIGKAMDKWNTALTNNGIDPADKYAYTNFFPYGYIITREGKYTYEKHIEEMVTKGKMDFLSYDLYPFQWPGTDHFQGGFYVNLAKMYTEAKKYNLPWWSCIQAGGEWVGNTVDLHTASKWPTFEQVLWEANMFLAYGAKGLDYFTLCQPHSYNTYIQYGGGAGLFDPLGNKTYLYYAAQVINQQALACDHMLMNATNHGIIQKGKLMGGVNSLGLTAEIKEDTFRELIGVTEECTTVIGCFDVYGKTMLYVMNSNWNEDTEVELEFDNTYAYDVVQRAEEITVVGKKLKLRLNPGEGVMVALR